MPLSPVSKRGELLGTFRSGLGEDGIRQRESIFEQTGNILQASRWLNFGAFFLRNEEQHFIPERSSPFGRSSNVCPFSKTRSFCRMGRPCLS